MGIFEKFKLGLNKSSKSFSDGFKNLVLNKKVDAETLDQLEDFLIESDVGVIAAKELKQIFSNATIDPSKNSIGQINSLVETYIKNLMFPLEKEIIFEKEIFEDNINHAIKKIKLFIEEKNIS